MFKRLQESCPKAEKLCKIMAIIEAISFEEGKTQMKQLPAIFLIGMSCFLSACVGKGKAITHINRGIGYYEQNKYDLAIESYREAISTNPENAYVYYLLGNAYLQHANNDIIVEAYQVQRRRNLARESFQKAITINPNLIEAHAALGIIYMLQGKYDLEIESFQKAITINPNYAYAHFNLGIAYRRRGNKQQAIIHYENFIRTVRGDSPLQKRIPDAEYQIQLMKSEPFNE
ncbi:tetratricopeptide repeat protein [Candidatus Poribacteria bacterium]|nr:tetratricopeptide repeat protein [Candidatus Poribacteria bacterium]